MRNEAMRKTTKIIKDMKVIDMNATSTTNMEDMEVKVDSLGITTTDRVGPSNVSHATKKDTDMQTVHIRAKLT